MGKLSKNYLPVTIGLLIYSLKFLPLMHPNPPQLPSPGPHPHPNQAPHPSPHERLPQPAHRPKKGIRKELSAGGVAARLENGEWFVALLKTEHKRGEVWVLPKGHVELEGGENLAAAAKREVGEEAGLKDLSVKNELGVTRFKFQAETAMVYKTVHYFLMITNQRTLVPQVEEGLIEAKWFPIDEALTALAYDTDQDIVSRAREVLTGKKDGRAPRGASPSGRPAPRIRI